MLTDTPTSAARTPDVISVNAAVHTKRFTLNRIMVGFLLAVQQISDERWIIYGFTVAYLLAFLPVQRLISAKILSTAPRFAATNASPAPAIAKRVASS